MRGCTCRGLVLCPQCAALAQRAGVLAPPEVPPVSEKAFMQAVVRVAKQQRWLVYHTWNSRKSAPGYFDCTLAKAGHPLVLAELKTATGTLTIEQQQWYDITRQTTGVECYIWRPDDMALIVEKLLQK